MQDIYTLGPNVLKVEGVSLQLDHKLILRDINLEIKEILRPNCVTGQIVGLLGPSGRGKTQLFKILSGLNKPTTGKVLVGPNLEPVKIGQVGVVAQNYPLFEHMLVKDNLLMVLDKKLSKDEKMAKMNKYLEEFGMEDHITKYPCQLSGGQRQRIAIIQQLLCSEHFLLLDEPFSGLDPVMTAHACDLISQIASMDERNTIIVVSHDIPSIVSIADILWILGFDYEEKDGKKCALPGARIKYVENLMDAGICWHHEKIDTPEYFDIITKIRKSFSDL